MANENENREGEESTMNDRPGLAGRNPEEELRDNNSNTETEDNGSQEPRRAPQNGSSEEGGESTGNEGGQTA